MLEANRIITGDCMDVMSDLPAESVHAVVCDPPYGLAFMGRSWDDFEPREYQTFCENWAREAKRVLKPGGHMLAFSGNRTHHRLFSGVEDAGFEVRDTVTWHYGTGFPKALDVSKAIDKQADAEREVVAEREAHDMTGGNYGTEEGRGRTHTIEETKPATDAAEEWDGFKTALKPATEYVVVARKPLGEDTVAENVLAHGTGALNIGETRIGLTDGEDNPTGSGNAPKDGEFGEHDFGNGGEGYETPDEGRYPANVVFGEQAAAALDAEVGPKQSGDNVTSSDGRMFDTGEDCSYTDTDDGPSRYFYTSKATKAERTLDGRIENAHPTVKPPDLMEWLVTLVTAEGQVVLDPFAGSGTTCKAAKDLQREFIGIEMQEQWADVARVRCGLTPEDPSAVRGDDDQQGLEQYE